MKIGKYTVGNYIVTQEGNKKKLVFDCRNCPYNTSIAEDARCRYHVLKTLETIDADEIILAEVYERSYDKIQTKFLKEMVNLGMDFENKAVWVSEHLNINDIDCDQCYPQRHNNILKFARELISYDPIASYITLLKEIENNKTREEDSKGKECEKCFTANINHLLNLKKQYEKTEFIRRIKPILVKSKDLSDLTDIYRTIFEVEIKPSFIGSKISFENMDKLELIDEYQVLNTNVQIFKHPEKIEYMYMINPPEYTLSPDHYFVLTKTKETVANYAPGTVTLTTGDSTRKYFQRIYQSTITDIARKFAININAEDIFALSEIVTRYTIGYGILELLLSDRQVTDVYLDSPLGSKPIYLVHSKYGQCQTNIQYPESDAESFIGKIRAMSGRPFDDAHPILDFDLPDLNTRIAIIGRPLATDGIAFAFRLHKDTPWTLPQLINVKSLNSLAAGMLSFFIDNNSTMLIAGSRGAGKTSLMTSLMLEILQNSRIIVQEDTLELPVMYMKDIGFNAQRLKTRSAIGGTGDLATSEVKPEDALRTALRLGDSALIVGEVRSVEAKVLYEAMRIGAAGNVVMGTIHADSAYAVWDRVVNDLEVPTTSFKATDIVVVAKPIRFKGSLKNHRRVVQITEVRKHWNNDPDAEGGLLNLMEYDASKDTLVLNEDALKDSEMFTKISKLSGMKIEEIWENINLRSKEKQFQVDFAKEKDVIEILEAEHTVFAHNKLLIMKEEYLEYYNDKLDYNDLYEKWKKWYTESFAPRVIKRIKDNRIE
ncbi:MAG: type II/IV secretion system ATPase subunit [Candidatus ainarchaeum sp.]|nr:type II/IV secretion system ATPase subunit [Candidatus ainarchaeum sp.]MDD3975703.1 type II/IV secretion system ATPase subunit [Candidatus ainarchaeum sp.]